MLHGPISKDSAIIVLIVDLDGIGRSGLYDKLAQQSEGKLACCDLVEVNPCDDISSFTLKEVSSVAGVDEIGVASGDPGRGAPGSSIDFLLDPSLIVEVDDEVEVVFTAVETTVIGFAVENTLRSW